MAGADSVVADLCAESDGLDALVADLSAERWRTETPAPGWTIAHQIAHLLWTDRVAVVAVTDEAAFGEGLAEAAKNPRCWPSGGAPGPGCTTNYSPWPTAASFRGSVRR
jgi:uncharacterized protein (TIGR03083 family)